MCLSLGSSDVHGTPATPEALREILATIPRSEAISLLCFVGSHWPGDHVREWIELERTTLRPFLLSPRTFRAVEEVERREGGPTVVFTRRRTLTLLRLACTACPELDQPAPQVDERTRYSLGEAFLLVGSLLDDRTPQQLEDGLGLIVPLFEESNPPSVFLTLSRAYAMATDPAWSREPVLQEASRRVTLDCGLDVRSYLNVVLGLLTKLIVRAQRPGHGLLKLTDAFTRARDRDGIRRVVESLSTPTQDLPAAVGSGFSTILTDRSQEPFRSRPLIGLPDDIFACADFRALADRAGAGVFWRIFDQFETEQERNQISAAWSKLFEGPVSARLAAAIDDSSWDFPPPRFVRSPCDDDGDELTDALITCGPHLILLEVKAFVLSERAKYSGTGESFLEEARCKLLKPVRDRYQLARALERLFGSRALRERYVGRRELRTIYPVVVCLDPAVTVPDVAPRLDALLRPQLRAIEVPGRPKIMPLSILNADDVDTLAAVIRSGLKPHEILKARFELDPSGGNTFNNFLFDLTNRRGVEKPGEIEEFNQPFEDAKRYWIEQATPPVFIEPRNLSSKRGDRAVGEEVGGE